MAVIRRAHDEQLGRDVAVKLLRPQFAADPAFAQRFELEARGAAGLSHPNIVQVYDAGTQGRTRYIVMELVEGTDLAAMLSTRGRLPVGEAVEFARGVSLALGAAHRAGLVHRDVKPANILIAADGTVKVADFGIARALSEASLTLTGMTLGSVHYVSPEQAQGLTVTPASDVYSLGVVLFEMLTGHRPFGGETAMSILVERLEIEPPSPAEYDPSLPPALVAVVQRAMAYEAEERFADGDALAAALDRAGAEVPAVTQVPAVAELGPGLAVDTTTGMSAGVVAGRIRSDELHRPEREPRRRGAPLLVAALALLLVAAVPLALVAQSLAADQASRGPAETVLGAVATERPSPSPEPTSAAATPTRQPSATPLAVTPPPATTAPTAKPPAVTEAPVVVPPPPAATAAPTRAPATAAPATAQPATPDPKPAAVPAPASSPGGTVARWYELVEAGSFSAAASMWTAELRDRYPPSLYIDDRFARTARIDLQRAELVRSSLASGTATVAVDLVEVLDDGTTRRFVGSWDLVRAGDGWLLADPDF
jgi:eukaryotic-like serine/threonine-protein kinase